MQQVVTDIGAAEESPEAPIDRRMPPRRRPGGRRKTRVRHSPLGPGPMLCCEWRRVLRTVHTYVAADSETLLQIP
jgi:hypothetical protein